MRGTGRSGPATGLVVAARAGDPRALDILVADCLPLVYNVVGRALRGHADVDDVVQETLLRVVHHLADLREPESFRSWLIAIAIRQVRDWEQRRRTERGHVVGVDVAHEVADPAADFAGLTILRLGLTDQRREVVTATRWLDPDDRELLALWWLEETGELDRAELAGALGVSGEHAAVRVQRMKEQLRAARAVVRALAARPGCPALRTATAGWDGVPAPLWRKRLARHVRECAECGPRAADLLPVDRLLAGLPLLPLPPGLADRVFAAVPAGPAPGAAPVGGGPAAGHGPAPAGDPLAAGSGASTTAASGGSSAAGRAASGGRSGRRLLSGRPRAVLVPVAAAAALVAVVAAALIVARPERPAAAPPADAGVVVGATAATAAATTPPAATPTPTPLASTPAAAKSGARPAGPAGPAVSSPKKGVAVWNFGGVSQALAASKASWYYTWSPQHSGITTPKGVGFVPMIWGAKDVNATSLGQAKNAGRYLLGFNEPDMGGQANLSVEQALDLWPQLQATGSILGSPAVAFGGDTPGGWLDRFMSGARARNLRVDFIALHWYGGDFVTANAVRQLKSYLQAVHDRYHLPIWLTEYALIDFSGGGARFPSQQQQAAFVTASARMLGDLSYVQRYAWFGLPATDKDRSGLFRSGTEATEVGRAFQAAG
ncbi:sigma-70 family RNA polymerase sigma factor [Micromonospora sp. NPDC049559]|uniref:sigma-70 family RNA polymerase sigma factor n=1 Tax=Micromonospora sp. NPDC049559 TaxID=3155923 RepID=UPI00343FBB25